MHFTVHRDDTQSVNGRAIENDVNRSAERQSALRSIGILGLYQRETTDECSIILHQQHRLLVFMMFNCSSDQWNQVNYTWLDLEGVLKSWIDSDRIGHPNRPCQSISEWVIVNSLKYPYCIPIRATRGIVDIDNLGKSFKHGVRWTLKSGGAESMKESDS